MRLRDLVRVSVVSSTILLSVTLSAQSSAPQTPQFRASTTLVPMDVRVVDKKGVPVTDLTAADFVLLENGVAQTIAHFATTTLSPTEAPAPGSRPRRASDAFELVSSNQRTFLIVLARGWLQAPSKGVDAAIHLVQDLAMPQDYVAVQAWDRATDFTTDRQVTLAVLERFKKDHGGIEASIVQWQNSLEYVYGDGRIPKRIQTRIDAVFGGPKAPRVRTMEGGSVGTKRLDDQRARLAAGAPDLADQFEMRDAVSLESFIASGARTKDDLSALYIGVEYMRHLAGQKHVIFVSEYGVSGRLDDDRSIGRRAADARVVLDIIHSGGMPCASRGCTDLNFFSPPPNMISTGISARAYSGLSGGQFFAHRNKNSSIDLDKIDQASRFHYTLGYYPLKEPTDGKYRRVEVKLLRKDLTVLARDGYFARAEIGPLDTRKAVSYGRVAGAAEHAWPISDLSIASITATAVAGRMPQTRVALTIDLSRVGFDRVNGLNVGSLEVAAFAVNRGREQAGHRWDTVNLTFTDDRLAEVLRTGLHYELTIDLTAKADEVKVVAYDYESDLVGSAVAKIGK